ncbi:MAG: P1 family peptidase [Pseudomonadota bacterium]
MAWFKPGPRNLITDVAGLRVGNASDPNLKSGVTALLCDVENFASVHVMGGAPGTRETDLLSPENTVESVDALVLSGGSAFGLDAATGVQSALQKQGKGFAVGPHRIPIVPSAILFDLINGGQKDWGDHPPYRALGEKAAAAANTEFALGSHGAGTGAITGGPATSGINGLKGGLGSASTQLPNGITVGALVAVNALGSPVTHDGAHFRAAEFECKSEFGGLGNGPSSASSNQALPIKFRSQDASKPQQPGTNTTIAIVATDAVLTKAQAKRFAVAAHDGFARALWPAHTPLDGDLVFGLATGHSGIAPDLDQQIDLSATAAATMSRAIARGVFEATTQTNDIVPTWQSLYG